MLTPLHRFVICLLLVLSVLALWQGKATAGSPEQSEPNRSNFGKLPLHFEANQGQTDGQVRYLARGRGYTLFLTPTETVLSLRKFEVTQSKKTKDRPRAKWRAAKSKYDHLVTETLRMRLLGANPQSRIAPTDELEGKVNYFIGNDPSQWRTDVPTFARIKYEAVYTGIDLIYYGNQGQLEYDFLVAPGADPGVIKFLIEGPGRAELDAEGRLVLEFPSGPVIWRKPVVFQEIDGQREPVAAEYELKNHHQFGFRLGAYDSSRPLIIDPALEYSTFLGGTSDDSARAIAVDAAGFVYIAGDTSSGNFPTRGPISGGGNLGGITDAFVSKLGPKGTNLVFSSYLGGNGFESAQGIAVDRATNVYVTGYTDSNTTFPTKNPYQNSINGDDDVFLSKLNAAGNSLLYSTYLGGSNDQAGLAVAVDTNGNAFVTGGTMSRNFPTRSAFQSTFGGAFTNTLGDPFDMFVAKFNTGGSGNSSLIYSTYLGGNDDDVGQGIAVDQTGNAYVVGYTYATNYPTTPNAISTNTIGFIDVVLSKLSSTGSNLLYSTYITADGAQSGNGIALGTNNFVYITGDTDSTNFPTTATAFMPNHTGGFDNAFVMKLNLALAGTNAILYSTYLGGNNDFGNDVANSVAVGTNGFIYVTGQTGSTDFPVSTGAFQPTYSGGFCDGFVTAINPNVFGSAGLLYSSYLGGPFEDRPFGIVVDAAGSVYVAGETSSTNFVTTAGAYQRTSGGSYDAFVTKIVPSTELGILMSSSPDPVLLGSPITYSITVTNIGELGATGAFVTNILPAGVSYVSATPTTGSVSQASGVVTWNLGNLATGKGAGMTITANAITPGMATNVVTIWSPQVDGNTNNNRAVTVNTLGSIVTVSATISNVTEGSPALGRFRIARSGITANAITVKFTMSGTATPGSDYTALPTSATIGAGLNAVLLNVAAIDDMAAECTETVVLNLLPDPLYSLGAPTNATVFIADNELPQVSVAATTPTTLEGGTTNGVFTISRVGCAEASLTVNYKMSGGASNGVDYTTLSGSAVIPVASNSVRVTVAPINDTAAECPETAVLTLSTNAAYVVAAQSNDTVTILDNDARLSIVATTPNASEAGTDGIFTIFRTGCTAVALTANYTIGGTANNGTDYSAIGTSVSFPVGVTNVTVIIHPLPDGTTEATETVVLTLAANANYTLSGTNSATVNIADYSATPVVSFTGTPTNGLVPFAVTFTDSSIGSIASRTWNFGDGTTSNTTSPSAISVSHNYADPGTYTVSLTASGPAGTNTQTRSNYITGILLPPELMVTPTSRNYGSVSTGQTNTLSFTVVNTGGGTLDGTAIVPAPFFVAGSPYSLGPGQTGIVAVSFAPTLPSTYNANVTFTSNGGSSTNPVTGVALTPGMILASPSTVNFGVVLTGMTAQTTMVVTNLGGTPVTNGVAAVTGGAFSVLSGSSFSVPGFGSTNIVVRFAPLSGDGFTNSIIFASANGGTVTNELLGIGAIVPVASFNAVPTSGLIPFAPTFTDTSTGTITNRVWNFGDGVTLTTNVTSLTHTYAARGTYTVRLIATGYIGVSTNTQNNLIIAQVPAQQVISPTSRDYGSVTIGQTNTLAFSVINAGDLTLSGTATAAPPYKVASGSPYNVAAGQTGTVMVSFIPISSGTFNTNVVFASNGGNSTNGLAGTGTTAGQVGVSPATMNFGTRPTGTITQAVFTVSNAGGTTISNGSATVTGGPFSIVSGSTFTVPPGGSTNVVVQFSPVAVGNFTNSAIFTTTNGGSSTNTIIGGGAIVPAASFNATPTNGVVPLSVTFTDTSTGTITNRLWSFGDGTTSNTLLTSFIKTYSSPGTNTVRLIVSGPVGISTNTQVNLIRAINPPILNVNPANRDFGAVTIGQTNSLTFSVINAGDQTLTGTAATTAPYAISSGSPFNVAPGQTGTVTVNFAPTGVGSFNANVTFASNGGASTNGLTGFGVTPGALSASPASVDFGVIATGSISQRAFSVTNTGGTTVSNGTASVTSGPFSIVSGANFSLGAGASTNVVVQFAPVAAGAFTNSVLFNSANGGSAANPVTGTGAIVPSANFTATPTNGTTPMVVTFTDTSTGTITNRNWSFGDGITLNTNATSLTHTYVNAGTNTVRLIASGPLGVSTNTKPNFIIVVKPPQQTITPINRDFGAVTIGETNTLSFSVINTGDLPLAGTASVGAPFAVAGSPYNVNPGQTGVVQASFIPTGPGTFSDSVIFNSNGGVSTNAVVGTGLTPGQLGVSPVMLNFGTLVTGTTSQLAFVINNSGGTDVTNGTASVTGGPFTILSGATFDVPAGGSTNVVIRFAPLVTGGFTNSVIFTSSNGGSSTNAVIGASAVVPVANFSATPTNGVVSFAVTFTDTSAGTITNRLWNFGDGATTNTISTNVVHTYTVAGTNTVRLIVSGPVGVSTNTKNNLIVGINPASLMVSPTSREFGSLTIGLTNTLTFSISNPGDVTLNGTAAVGAPFAVVSGSPFTIAAKQTGTVTVSFAPISAGGFNDNVIFSSNGGVSTNPVSGAGLTKGQIVVSPTTHDFGTMATGTTSQRVFTVTNTGGTTVSNGFASVTGGPFSIISGNSFSLLGGTSTNVVVQFAPVAAGSFTNSVLFTSANGGSSTNTVLGTGAIVPAASFSATPTTSAVPFTVTFTDTSTGTITNRFWSFGDGATTNTLLTTVTHNYTVAGTNSVSLIVSGPVGVSPLTKANLIVALNPAHLAVTPASRNFGPVTIGLTNQTTFSVINSGDLPLTGSASANAPFAIVNGSPFNVAGGQTGTVTISFAPNTPATFNDQIVFTTNGGTSTNSVSGDGLTPGQIGVSPASRNFGTIATGTTSQQVFTVTNSGGTTVSNGMATLTGGPFAITSGAAFSLAGGASTNVVIQFAPVAVGGFTNAVVFNSANGGSSTNSIFGNGAVVPSASFTASPTNGAVPLVVTFTDTSTGTITNRFWNFGDGTTSNTTATSLTHTYVAANSNTVQLTVSGPLGVSTNTKPNLVIAVNPPKLVVNPLSRNFGPVTIGLTNTLTFAVANTGDQPLNGTAAVPPPFAIVSGSPYSVNGGQTGTISVSFSPVTNGVFSNEVVFVSNGGGSTNSVAGIGLTPGRLFVDPSSFNYGTIAVNTSRQTLFTVSNFGGTTVSNGTATVTGGPFAVVSGSAFDLAAGGSVSVIVSFTPTSVGSFSNAVIVSSANGGVFTNTLIGGAAFVPVADFSATPVEGLLPLTVSFTDASTGTIDGRLWMFGDGATSTEVNPSHQYTAPGTFTVSLMAFGPAGTNTETKSDLITVVDPQLFERLAGTYYGLSMDDPPTFQNSGYVVLKIAKTRVYKGTLQQGKTKTKFAGTFDDSGNATTTVSRTGLPDMTMALHLDGSGSEQVTGEVAIDGYTAQLVANRDVSKTSASPLSGLQFTALLPADVTNTTQVVPLGDGFGTVLIKSPGKVALSGYTGDGQKFKQKVPVSKFGTWPMYVPLYKKGVGAMFGWVTHTNVVGISDFDAPLHWHKPPATGTPINPDGFDDDIFMVGAEYTRPLPGHAVLTLTNRLDNSQITLGDGDLPESMISLVTVTQANAVLSTNLTVKITTSKGLFKGKFKHPTTGGTVPFQGAFLQKQNFGSGFFLGTNQSGFVTFEPTP